MEKKRLVEFSLEEIVEIYNIGVDELKEKLVQFKIPMSKGRVKKSVLDKYFEIRNQSSFESVVIAVSNQKGGEGKTTLSLYLSEALSKEDKVLLVDWDAQANSTRLFFQDLEHTIFDCLPYRNNQSPVPLERILKSINPNFSIAPSSISLENFTTPYERDDFELLTEILIPIRSSFKYIIIDCPPSLGLALENALIASDYVMIPIQTRAFSVQGLSDLQTTIEKIKRKANPNLVLLGAVLNLYEESRAMAGLSKGIKKYFPVFDTVIPRRESIPQSQATRKMLKGCDTLTRNIFYKLANEVREKTNV